MLRTLPRIDEDEVRREQAENRRIVSESLAVSRKLESVARHVREYDTLYRERLEGVRSPVRRKRSV
jgi:hypothetical protein